MAHCLLRKAHAIGMPIARTKATMTIPPPSKFGCNAVQLTAFGNSALNSRDEIGASRYSRLLPVASTILAMASSPQARVLSVSKGCPPGENTYRAFCGAEFFE